MCTSSVSNVIYHKFLHGAAFYTLSGKNINVMLELHVNKSRLERIHVLKSYGHYVDLVSFEQLPSEYMSKRYRFIYVRRVFSSKIFLI